jgi:serine/threonine protein kinase
MAPELLSGRTHSTPKIDVWSMGCMLYAMVTGEYPFAANDREELKK